MARGQLGNYYFESYIQYTWKKQEEKYCIYNFPHYYDQVSGKRQLERERGRVDFVGQFKGTPALKAGSSLKEGFPEIV